MGRSLILLAALALVVPGDYSQIITTHGSDGSIFTSSRSANGEKYHGQWTVGELTCYIAKDRVNGVQQVVKQCRNGHLGRFHDMTKEEEVIIEEQIRKTEAEKQVMNKKIAENNAIMQNSMRSMNNHIQRNLQGMHTYMGQMQRMMQQQMQNAFAPYG